MTDSTVHPRARAFGTCDVHEIAQLTWFSAGLSGPDAIVVKRFDDTLWADRAVRQSLLARPRQSLFPRLGAKFTVWAPQYGASIGLRRITHQHRSQSGKLASFEELLERSSQRRKKGRSGVVPHSEQQISPGLADNNSLSTASPASACLA